MKKLFAISIAIAMICTIAACGSGVGSSTTGSSTAAPTAPAGSSAAPADEAVTGTIGVLLPSLAFDFQARMAAGVRRAAEENGFGYQEVDYNSDAELQVSGMETLVAAGVDGYYGIFQNAGAASSLIPQTPEVAVIAQRKGVPANAFIVNDYFMLGTQFVESLEYFFSKNDVEKGELACIWLAAAEVEDSADHDALVDAKSIIEPYCQENGINYVSDQFADNDEEASLITEQLLNAYPNLRYVFCMNNGYAIAAANEISAAGVNVDEYLVFSSEGDAESFRLIGSGDSPYRACAYNDIENTGYQTGLQLVNWVKNGVIEDVVVNKVLVDERNVDGYRE